MTRTGTTFRTAGGQGVRVLLVQDDGAASDALASALTREGLRVRTAASTDDALRQYSSEPLDVAVLHADASGFDALRLCRALLDGASRKDVPIVLLGSRVDDSHVAAAYAAGADAYVSLPCAPPVLAARLQAHARAGASHAVARLATADRADQTLHADAWELHPETQEVRRTGHGQSHRPTHASLTPTEFRMFYLLLANAGRVVPVARLSDYAGVARVRSHVSRLRQKLGLLTSGAGAIEAEEGLGYRYVPTQHVPTAPPAS